MSKSLWAQIALLAAAMTGCAATQGSQRAETSSSYRGVQAPSVVAHANAGAATSGDATLAQQPAGQAAQQYSWIGEPDPVAPDRTPLAQDGPLYLGGRYGQPGGWDVSAKREEGSSNSTLAAGPTSSRQH